MKKGKFADKAKGIIDNRKPKGLSDFLEEDKKNMVRKAVNTDLLENDITDKRKTVREEFRLPEDLAENLRTYAFHHRTTKTTVVIEALNEFLKDRS